MVNCVCENRQDWPETNSQQKTWTKYILARSDSWIAGAVAPLCETAIAQAGLNAKVDLTGNGAVTIAFSALTTGTGYAPPRVLLGSGRAYCRVGGAPLLYPHCDDRSA